MDHHEAGRYWNDNAPVWTQLARQGFDVYRNHLNAPAFLQMLPDVTGLTGLDLGCGEGYNTRGIARRGALIHAVDISENFIHHAQEAEAAEPLGIHYQVASAVELPFPDHSFDFATATMSLMDMPEIDSVFREAFRVIRPAGFFQFSITHPCFDTPHRRNLRNEQGITYAIEVGNYFDGSRGRIEEWIFNAAPAELRAQLPKFRVPLFHRPLSVWMNTIVATGFQFEHMEEPRPSDAIVRQVPNLQDNQVVPYFLHVRVRKP